MPPLGRKPLFSSSALNVTKSADPKTPKPARMPWEREEDDEFGPPPALDVTPGEAESEAKRMIYEKSHPLHDALLQNAHLDHNLAMRRYSALARRAWDPAAQTIPVQPARPIADTGTSPLRVAARDPALELLRPQTKDSGKSYPRPLQAADADLAPLQGRTQPPPPQEYRRRGEQVDPSLLQDAAFGRRAARERDRWRATAMASLSATERLRDPVRPTTPHSINETRFAEASQIVYARDDLSDVMKYSLLRIFGYEDTKVNPLNQSRAGLLMSTYRDDWAARLKQFVDPIRTELGKPELTGEEAVADLSLDDIIDVQKAYLILALVDPKKWPTSSVSNFDPLADFGTGELPAQIADTVYRHGGEGGLKIVQRAINQVIASLPEAERTRLKLPASIEDDGYMGEVTHDAIAALASSDATAAGLLSAIQFERAREMMRNGEYRGADRRRLWGWHEDRPGL